MYDGSYDEYIRSILGYNQNELYDYGYNDNYNNYRMQDNIAIVQNSQLEQSYPEIYKVVYPMVSKRCENVRAELSNEELEKMTDEIYFALESKNETQLNINLKNDVRTSSNANVRKAEVNVTENSKGETRQFNSGLRDLVKILLIRELLNRPRPFPPRPPVRPPMPPGPGPRPPRPPMRPPFGPGGRPPFPREFEVDNYDLYEM